MADTEIKLGELKTIMKGWMPELFAELQKTSQASGAAETAKAAQEVSVRDTAQVAASVDGKPVVAELLKPETKVNMGAVGIAGLVESGDHFRILQFKLGPVTSALVGIPTGMVLSGAINNWLLPYRDAAGTLTKVRPATVGFGQINFLNPAAHVGGMVLSETFVAGFLGETAAHFISGTLLLSTLLTYTPLGTWLTNAVTAISPRSGTVAQNRGMSSAQVNVLRQRQAQEQRQAQGSSNGRRGLSWT